MRISDSQIGQMTSEETADAAARLLEMLTFEDAMPIVKRWAEQTGMLEEVVVNIDPNAY